MNLVYDRRVTARVLGRRVASLYAAALILMSFFLLLAVMPLIDAGHAALAQEPRAGIDKLDSRLKLLLGSASIPQKDRAAMLGSAGDETSLLIQGDQRRIAEVLRAHGGRIITVIGDICTARLPRTALLRVAADVSIRRIEGARPMRMMNGKAVTTVRADKVHAGAAPLTTGYTGKGVLIGIVDTGIDWTHRDFRDAVDTNLSRVVAIWDQRDHEGPSPAVFGYGTLWTGDQITAALRSGNHAAVRHVDTMGHGTHVSGTAAGNGAAIGKHAGVAPEAGIAVVSLDWEKTTSLIDAADYLFRLGIELGRPVVINMSLGFEDEVRDGTSLFDQALNFLVTERPGRFVCVSAGNDGGENTHWGSGVSADSVWTWAIGDATYASSEDRTIPMVLNGIVATGDLSRAEISIAIDSIERRDGAMIPHLVAQLPWTPLSEIVASEAWVRQLLYRDGSTAATAVLSASRRNDRETGITVAVNDAIDESPIPERLVKGQDLVRLMIRGVGKIHLWKLLAEPVRPETFGLQVDGGYRNWDGNYGVVSPGTADHVLTVGASNNMMVYDGYNGHPVTYAPETEGGLAPFSSAGPTIDGRMKPEIVAPGHGVISALGSILKSFLDPTREESGVAAGGEHVIMSGTSMSSPVAAGAVALFLQRYPMATADEIKRAITSTARRDDDMLRYGSLPNAHWGYGKLDIFAAITAGMTSSVPQAPVSAGGSALSPNPAGARAFLSLELGASERVRVELIDPLGRIAAVVADEELPAGRRTVVIDVAGLPSSVYTCRVTAGARHEAHRLVVRH